MDFNVTAEFNTEPTRDLAEQAMDALREFSPAVGRSAHGRTDVVFTVPALSIGQASQVGWGLLVSALPVASMLRFEVMPTALFDARLNDVAVPELVGATEAARILGVTRQRMQQMAAAGQVPSVHVGRALAFPRGTIEAAAKKG